MEENVIEIAEWERGFSFAPRHDDHLRRRDVDASAASAAISEMDGTTLDGRSIKVNEAQERNRGGNRGGGRW